MELKVNGASMVLPKRAFRPCKARNYQANVRRNMLEAIVNANDGGIVSCVEEDGVVRVKIVVKKQDVKQMLQVMRSGSDVDHHKIISNGGDDRRSSNIVASSSSAEQRLNLLREKHLLRVDEAKESHRSSSWSPALQSIPEEV